MKYIQCKVMRDAPATEQDYLIMDETVPKVLAALIESTDYLLTYIAEDDVEAGEVWVAPYGKGPRIVVTTDVTPELSDSINYRKLLKRVKQFQSYFKMTITSTDLKNTIISLFSTICNSEI